MARRVVASSLFVILALVLMVGCGARAIPGAYEARDVAPSAPVEDSFAQSGGGTANPIAGAGEWEIAEESRMIIYTGDLALVVQDTDSAQEAVISIAETAGGYIASASSYAYEGGLRRVTISLRVPAGLFNATMDALRELALEVVEDSIGSQDVTQEYVDLVSRLAALEAKASRLEQLMEDAEDTEAVLAVYEELSETQIRIEETKGRMQYLERHATMATINVSLTPDALSQPVEIAGWRPVGTIKRAIEALVATFQFLADAAIWLVLLVAPVVGIFALVIYIFVRLIMWIVRRVNKKESNSKAAST